MKKKYTFKVEQDVYPADGTYKPGQIHFSAGSHKHFGDYHGFLYSFDTRAEAEQCLYDYQAKHNIPDNDIEWVNIKPKTGQMELF